MLSVRRLFKGRLALFSFEGRDIWGACLMAALLNDPDLLPFEAWKHSAPDIRQELQGCPGTSTAHLNLRFLHRSHAGIL